jgi:hypothetical protein
LRVCLSANNKQQRKSKQVTVFNSLVYCVETNAYRTFVHTPWCRHHLGKTMDVQLVRTIPVIL